MSAEVDYWITLNINGSTDTSLAAGSTSDEDKVEIEYDATILWTKAYAFDPGVEDNSRAIAASNVAEKAMAIKMRISGAAGEYTLTKGNSDYVPLDVLHNERASVSVAKGTLLWHQWKNNLTTGNRPFKGRVILGLKIKR